MVALIIPNWLIFAVIIERTRCLLSASTTCESNLIANWWSWSISLPWVASGFRKFSFHFVNIWTWNVFFQILDYSWLLTYCCPWIFDQMTSRNGVGTWTNCWESLSGRQSFISFSLDTYRDECATNFTSARIFGWSRPYILICHRVEQAVLPSFLLDKVSWSTRKEWFELVFTRSWAREVLIHLLLGPEIWIRSYWSHGQFLVTLPNISFGLHITRLCPLVMSSWHQGGWIHVIWLIQESVLVFEVNLVTQLFFYKCVTSSSILMG